MGQQRPGHARHLVGERHRHDLEGSPRQELREPGILLRRRWRAYRNSRTGSDHQNASQIAIALFRDRPELLLAASRIFGAVLIPKSQAAKSRPDRKTFGSGMVAAIAVAPITPIPGMLSSRWLASFPRCCILIRFSIAPITLSNASSCAASTMTLALVHRSATACPVRPSCMDGARGARGIRRSSEAFGCGHVFGL